MLRLALAIAALAAIAAIGCDRHRPEGPGTPAATQVASQPPFAGDPHTFDCSGCHRSPPGTPVTDWRPTCTRSGCHPQVWTRTIFHRVHPDIFSNCTNCHQPHTWVATGDDCRSCHASMHGPLGTVIADRIEAAPIFPHDRHARLECTVCHRLETVHADLTLTRAEQCDACHHGPPAAAACTNCHPMAETAGARTRSTRLQLAVWDAPRDRRLPFDHARHAGIDCERCHEPTKGWAPADNCASCHTEHHRAEATCIACHAEPPARAHTLDVHAGGCRECHGATSPPEMQLTRNFCLACHQDQVQHMPTGNCADCHKLVPGDGSP